MVNLEEEGKYALLDVLAAVAKVTSDVLDQVLSANIVENLAEELTRLLVVVVLVGVGSARDTALHWVLVPRVSLLLDGATQGVGLIVGGGTEVSVHAHGTVTDVVGAHASAVGAVNGDLVVVGAQTVTMGVRVVQQTALEHLVVGGLDTGHKVRGSEGRLLGLRVVVLGVAVQGELSYGNERVVLVRPHLGHIVGIITVVVGILDGHNLDVPGPGGEVACLDGVEKVVGGVVLVNKTLGLGFGCSEVLNALVRLEVVLDEVSLTLRVNPLEGVGGVAVHVAVAIGSATIREEDGDLVEGFGGEGPEVPSHVGVLRASLRVSLLAVDEVRELHGVLDEEHGCVVADHIVVALLSVELDGEAAGVTVAVVGAALTGHS